MDMSFGFGHFNIGSFRKVYRYQHRDISNREVFAGNVLTGGEALIQPLSK